jgi:hypothetical protein
MLSKILLSLARIYYKGHGFNAQKIRKQINTDGDHWFLGANNVPMEVLQENGQWDEYLPEDEFQNMNGVETWACTCYGTLNALEILIKKKFGKKSNWAERYLAVLSAIRYGAGGSPHTVAENVRVKGNVAQSLLPFDTTITSWNKFMSPNPMTADMISQGRKWLDEYDFNHEWISNLTTQGLKDALRYSPLGIAVYAWYKKGEFYYNPGRPDNHWVCCYGYVDGQYWKIYDSYDNTHKKIAWNYPFQFGKRYYIAAKSYDQVSAGRDLHERLIGKIIIRAEANGELYVVEKDKLAFVGFFATHQRIREEFNKYLREQQKKGNFIGISEKDFADLSTAIVSIGGTVEKPYSINDLIK